MGFELTLEALPQRIVSLVPSQTELLYDLGLEDRIVGVTKFCVHPERARKTKTIIGGTKKFDLDRIVSLKPDLIVGNKEENYPGGIAFLRDRYPVWMSDIYNLDDALGMITSVSVITGTQAKGEWLVQNIDKAFRRIPSLRNRRTLYLMWHSPWMGAASRTFIDHLMQRMGLQNVLAGRERYPELTEEDIIGLKPELVLLSSEPFPFADKHVSSIQALLPRARVLLVDGELFSWYGSRLVKTAAYAGLLADQLNQT